MKEFLNFCVRANGGGYNKWFFRLCIWLLCLLSGRRWWRQLDGWKILRKKSIDNLSLLSCREEIASESQNEWYEEIINEFPPNVIRSARYWIDSILSASSAVRPVCLTGAAYSVNRKRLEALHHTCVRGILNVTTATWKIQREVREIIQQQDMSEASVKRTHVGVVMCQTQKTPEQRHGTAIEWIPHERRNRNRPRITKRIRSLQILNLWTRHGKTILSG